MATEIEKIYAVAIQEVGYLEKASNAYLDDKTKNAGYNNYTKYWRDTRLMGLMTAYGYPASSNFAGGVNWPYCADGVFWAFAKALGQTRALELLLHTAAFINCDTLANKSKMKGQLYSSPKVGDVALFYNSKGYYHTEWVWKVDSTRFYTIGWNTSGASSVIANGGGVCSKKYVISSTKAKFHRPLYKDTVESVKEDTSKNISVTYLKLGSTGNLVKDIQKKLIYLGYSCGSCGVDGSFGNDTYKAVTVFQKDNNLTVDGIVGENTTTKLNILYNAKVEENNKTITTSTSKSTNPSERSVLFVGECTGNAVNVRTWAGREYGNIKGYPHLNKGNRMDVLDYTQKDSNGESWYYIRITDTNKNKYHGFIHSKYVKKVS